MTQARRQLVPPGADGHYHCVQRCVRRAFLCGVDHYSGTSFEHRKAWVEQRLGLLAECFAVSIHAYAVMSNHLHLVVQLAPRAAANWSDADVAARRVRLFPPRSDSVDAVDAKCRRLLDDAERLRVVRGRLCDLSWLMRCLAEPIARQANREDGCKGRFWEGRFKAQALCDERALLAAMAYVDLNPIRAGIAHGGEDAAHTSAAARITRAAQQPRTRGAGLGPILGVLQPLLAGDRQRRTAHRPGTADRAALAEKAEAGGTIGLNIDARKTRPAREAWPCATIIPDRRTPVEISRRQDRCREDGAGL